MKFISWNVNGIRAVERKGEIQRLVSSEKPDVLFLQETKAHPEQLSKYLVESPDYHQEYHSAEKKGYSGVSVWLHKNKFEEPPEVVKGMKGWNDSEGSGNLLFIWELCFFWSLFPQWW